jgi:hypothetical protein
LGIVLLQGMLLLGGCSNSFAVCMLAAFLLDASHTAAVSSFTHRASHIHLCCTNMPAGQTAPWEAVTVRSLQPSASATQQSLQHQRVGAATAALCADAADGVQAAVAAARGSKG